MKDLDLLHEELETHRKTLRNVDDSIKRLNGNERDKASKNKTEETRTSASSRIVKLKSDERVVMKNGRNDNNDKSSSRRPLNETNSRKRSSNHLDEDSDEEPRKRPSIQSSVVSSTMPIKTKEDLIKLQNKDSNSQLRNKRMLGFILGTLKDFRADDKQRSSTQQAQQRKELEEKIEIKKIEERQRMIEEKKRLEDEKYRETRNIEIVEKKIELTEQFETWKKNQLSYKMFFSTKFIKTLFNTDFLFFNIIHDSKMRNIEKLAISK